MTGELIEMGCPMMIFEPVLGEGEQGTDDGEWIGLGDASNEPYDDDTAEPGGDGLDEKECFTAACMRFLLHSSSGLGGRFSARTSAPKAS